MLLPSSTPAPPCLPAAATPTLPRYRLGVFSSARAHNVKTALAHVHVAANRGRKALDAADWLPGGAMGTRWWVKSTSRGRSGVRLKAAGVGGPNMPSTNVAGGACGWGQKSVQELCCLRSLLQAGTKTASTTPALTCPFHPNFRATRC